MKSFSKDKGVYLDFFKLTRAPSLAILINRVAREIWGLTQIDNATSACEHFYSAQED